MCPPLCIIATASEIWWTAKCVVCRARRGAGGMIDEMRWPKLILAFVVVSVATVVVAPGPDSAMETVLVEDWTRQPLNGRGVPETWRTYDHRQRDTNRSRGHAVARVELAGRRTPGQGGYTTPRDVRCGRSHLRGMAA